MRLIDADALVKRYENDPGFDISVHTLKCEEDAPTIDPEELRPKGEWECTSETMPIYRCSVCKERNLFKKGNNVFSNYCPRCGADMRGAEYG
jgi:DNA-directed RNA polymerase subunit RPC12/RpoP